MIIAAQYTNNNKVLLIDKDGQFIMYLIAKNSVQFPRGLSVADNGVLWVGEEESKKIHLIKYM